jgi:Zn-dependent protease/predicted transcriptional regulator
MAWRLYNAPRPLTPDAGSAISMAPSLKEKPSREEFARVSERRVTGPTSRTLAAGRSVRVLTVAGIPINVHTSWLVVYALITWTLAVGYFPRTLPDLSPVAAWLSGLAAALLLFVSVLLHELSHSVVARAHGLGVRGITLHIFGGVSQLEEEPPSARAEFLIAAVGPLSSFAIAGLLWGVRTTGVVTAGVPGAILDYLIFVNTAIGVFNLVPGFPLDGGRVLRAALWKWKGGLRPATYIASRVGSAVAVVLMMWGFLQVMTGAFIGGVWMILIGIFLRGAADASYAQIDLKETLAPLHVDDIMVRNPVTAAANAPLATLVDLLWAHHFTSFPVVEDGRVVGIATLQHVQPVPREHWQHTLVREVMQPIGPELTVERSDTVYRAYEKASRNGLGRLAVVDGDRLVGYLSLKDITHVLALRGVAPPKDRQAPVLRRAA